MPSIKIFPNTITPVQAWTNPDNAKAEDGVYATTLGKRNVNCELIATNFDISSIPANATINNVTLEVKYKVSSFSTSWTGTLAPYRNGSIDTENAVTTTASPNTDTVWQNDSTGTWTLSDLSSSNNGLLFRVNKTTILTRTWSVDYLAIVVDYSLDKPEISLTVDRNKLSGQAGFTRSYATFTSTEDLAQWEARATIGDGTLGQGLLVGSGQSLPKFQSGFFEIDYDELTFGDQTYTITVYGLSEGGQWSE